MTATAVAFQLTPALWLVLDSIAVYRLTRLTTTDTVTEAPRQWVKYHVSEKAYLVLTCAWCVAMWIAAAVVLLTVFLPHQWQYVAYVLTSAAVAGFLSERA